MEFKKLERNKKVKIIICFVFLLLLLFTIILMVSKAKYQVTKSVSIVNGNVSYSPYDFMIVEIQKEKDTGGYEITDKVPTTGYEIDESQSKCMIDETHEDEGAVLKTIDGNHTFSNLKKRDKCTLYFSKEKTTSEKTLANLKLGNSLGTITTVTGPSCKGNKNESCYSTGTDNKKNNMAENGVYDTVDDYGKTYVFRGFVQNNWVKFGKKDNDDIWWRIIRINGNGTIRLIYAGIGSTAPATDTSATQIGTKKFNSTRSDNRYVGFMYNTNSDSSQDDLDSNPSSSTIKGELDTWWGQTTLGNSGNKEKIDVDTGFCNDRSLSPVDHEGYKGPGGGSGTSFTAYAGYHRTINAGTTWNTIAQEPTLKCANPKRDLFTGPSATAGGIQGAISKIEGNNKLTNPVGLITMDEVIYAGGFAGQYNDGYWLYTKQNYWTMSPSFFDSWAYVFLVGSDGSLVNPYVTNTYGVRPVINLKADTQFTGNGTTSSPFVVQ